MARPRDDRQKDLFRPALEEIIDLGHPLVRLAREIDWGFLDQRFASVCARGPGQPGLPTRLVAGLLIVKHMHNLSDEALCARYRRLTAAGKKRPLVIAAISREMAAFLWAIAQHVAPIA